MKGPKGILAEEIANALADYFVVDPKAMKTNLLSNAGVKLYDTQLKYQESIVVSGSTTASVNGIVKYVAFEWEWGKSEKDGGSDWVKDARLSMSGLNVTMTLSHTRSAKIPSTTTPENTENSNDQSSNDDQEPATGFMGYVQDQVQGILDTLTLTIDDVLLNVVLPDGSSLQFGGSGMEISSMGRTVGEPLLQQFQIQRLFANVKRDEITFSVLEDIFYKAEIQRAFGDRFAAGFEQGLQVVGESNDHGVIMHVGAPQIEVINTFMGLLVEHPTAQASTRMFKQPASGEQLSERKQNEVPEGEPSFIGLKLAGVSLVLPNGAKLSLSDLMLKYQMDGTMLCVEGKKGFLVDDYPLLGLGETSTWSADLINSHFSIEDTALSEGANNDEAVCFLHVRQKEIKRVSKGLNDTFMIYQRLLEVKDGAVSRMTAKQEDEKLEPTVADSTSGAAWSFDLVGKVGCIVEQQEDSEISMTLCDAKGDAGTMTVELASIDELQIPNKLHLAEPIVKTKFQFDGSHLSAVFQDVVVVLEEAADVDQSSQESGKKKDAHGNNPQENSFSSDEEDAPEKGPSKEETSPMTLPFGLQMTINKFLAFKVDGKSVHTTLDALTLNVNPIKDWEEPTKKADIRIVLSLNEMNHDMLRIVQPSLALAINLATLDPIHDLHFGAEEMYVAAGYSISDWKALLPKKRQQQIAASNPPSLPNAHIDGLKIVVLVKGPIRVKDSVLRVGSFEGTESTTTSDITKFYKDRVIAKVPEMIASTSVLGVNASDGIVGNVGGGFIGNAVGGAGIGGLMSVAAFDGICNTIKEGKVSRGVAETEKWQLSDFALGLQHAAIRATREGAAKRGKGNGDRGNVADWTVGASSDFAKYGSENKARLGGAGAGALGFATGFAMGGPVGAIIGTVVASAGTQKTIEKVDEAAKGIGAKQKLLDLAKEFIIKDTRAHSIAKAKDDGSAIEGLLLKRRNFVKWEWHYHYFVLEDDTLKYYALNTTPPKGHIVSVNDTGTTVYMNSSDGPTKALELNNHYVGKDGNLSRPDEHLFVFTICSYEQSGPLWVLAAASEESRSQWMTHLYDVMSRNTQGLLQARSFEATSLHLDQEEHASTLQEKKKGARPFAVRLDGGNNWSGM